QLPLQRVGHHDVGTAADEQLADDGGASAHGGRHGHVGVYGHIAPAEYDLPFVAHGAFKLLLTGQGRGGFPGQEHHGDAVVVGGRQVYALGGHVGTVQGIWNLDEDAGAIAHQFVCADSAAMVEVLQDLQALLNDGVTASAFDMGDEAN